MYVHAISCIRRYIYIYIYIYDLYRVYDPIPFVDARNEQLFISVYSTHSHDHVITWSRGHMVHASNLKQWSFSRMRHLRAALDIYILLITHIYTHRRKSILAYERKSKCKTNYSAALHCTRWTHGPDVMIAMRPRWHQDVIITGSRTFWPQWL